jgi:hypothetical protein
MPAMAGIYPLAQNIKVFCFFSSEKKTLACLAVVPALGCAERAAQLGFGTCPVGKD